MTLINRICLMKEYPMKKTVEETDLPLVLAQAGPNDSVDDKRSIRNAA